MKQQDVSFTDFQASRWLRNTKAEDGFCSKRWKSDFVVEGLRGRKTGDRIRIGEESFVLTEIGKRCYEDCPLRLRLGGSCPLASGVAFGKREH